MLRATAFSFQTSTIVYDVLLVALAETSKTVVVTADDKLLKKPDGTPYANLAHPLADVEFLASGTR